LLLFFKPKNSLKPPSNHSICPRRAQVLNWSTFPLSTGDHRSSAHQALPLAFAQRTSLPTQSTPKRLTHRSQDQGIRRRAANLAALVTSAQLQHLKQRRQEVARHKSPVRSTISARS
jgi:hypothetical protein